MGRTPERLALLFAGFGLAVLTACGKDTQAVTVAPTVEPDPTAVPTLTAVPTPESTPTLVPYIPSPTVTTEPTPKPTPTEAPKLEKVVYWTDERILKAQEEGLAQRKVLLLDTWSALGGHATIIKSGYGDQMLGITGLSKGTTLPSPVQGKVASYGGSVPFGQQTPDSMFLNITTGAFSLIVFTNPQINFPNRGGPLRLNEDIIKFNSNDTLPDPWKGMTIAIGIEDKQTGKKVDFNEINILKDANGATVRSLSQAK